MILAKALHTSLLQAKARDLSKSQNLEGLSVYTRFEMIIYNSRSSAFLIPALDFWSIA